MSTKQVSQVSQVSQVVQVGHGKGCAATPQQQHISTQPDLSGRNQAGIGMEDGATSQPANGQSVTQT